MAQAISVSGLGKRYRVGKAAAQYLTLREAIAGSVLRFGRGSEERDGVYWALREVSFEVPRGEVLGVIGPNGAGKSTLLKILARITRPTEGRIELDGRVGSLLEVGTGFHPELTGRENVFLSGVLLGMSQAEVSRRFDEIIAFAGVGGEFLDVPTKRYSSGMQVRLAFAVAAHLEPDILILDEVLAVGDAAFQRRSLSKIGEVARSGRTVLFVSHNMSAIQAFCDRLIVLQGGRLTFDGPVRGGVQNYLALSSSPTRAQNLDQERRPPGLGDAARIESCAVVDGDGQTTNKVPFGQSLAVRVCVRGVQSLDAAAVIVGVESVDGFRIGTLVSPETLRFQRDTLLEAQVTSRLRLSPGEYALTLAVRSGRIIHDRLPQACRFEVSELAIEGQEPHNGSAGAVHLEGEWLVVPRGGNGVV